MSPLMQIFKFSIFFFFFKQYGCHLQIRMLTVLSEGLRDEGIFNLIDCKLTEARRSRIQIPKLASLPLHKGL